MHTFELAMVAGHISLSVIAYQGKKNAYYAKPACNTHVLDSTLLLKAV